MTVGHQPQASERLALSFVVWILVQHGGLYGIKVGENQGISTEIWHTDPKNMAYEPPFYRERKLNPNFFSLKLFGHPRDIPAKSRDIPPKKFDFPGFGGHTELFGPHPFVWKTPTPPENIRAQKFRFGFVFRAWFYAIWTVFIGGVRRFPMEPVLETLWGPLVPISAY